MYLKKDGPCASSEEKIGKCLFFAADCDNGDTSASDKKECCPGLECMPRFAKRGRCMLPRTTG